MKVIFIAIPLIISLLIAKDDIQVEIDVSQKQIIETCKDLKVLEIKQRRCCSWHGGVAGCVTCNDGTLSPSCTCNVPQSPLG